MPDQKLLDYIKEQLSKGSTIPQVRATLSTSGWKESDVDLAFKQLSKSISDTLPPPPPPPSMDSPTLPINDRAERENPSMDLFIYSLVFSSIIIASLGIMAFYGEKTGIGIGILMLGLSISSLVNFYIQEKILLAKGLIKEKISTKAKLLILSFLGLNILVSFVLNNPSISISIVLIIIYCLTPLIAFFYEKKPTDRSVWKGIIFYSFITIIVIYLFFANLLYYHKYYYSSQSIEIGWLFLGPFLYVVYSLTMSLFLNFVELQYLTSVKQKIDYPLIKINFFSKLPIFAIFLIFIYISFTVSFYQQAIEDKIYYEKTYNNPWQIRDRQREKDRIKISDSILSYKKKYNKPPSDLDTLRSANYNIPVDPLTNNQYAYFHNDINGNFAVCIELEVNNLNLKDINCYEVTQNGYSKNTANYLSYEGVEVEINRYEKSKISTDPSMTINSGRLEVDSGNHIVHAIVVGTGCSGSNGHTENTIDLGPHEGTNYYDYSFNWYIWDTGCGFEKTAVLTFTVDNKEAGISYIDDGGKMQTCLPFIANKIVKNVLIIPDKKQNLDCSMVKLYPIDGNAPIVSPQLTPKVLSVDERDYQRKNDLNRMQAFINTYKSHNGSFPQTLSQIVGQDYLPSLPMDPLTTATYTYTPNQNKTDYQLCASFETITQKCINSSTIAWNLK